MLITNRNAVMLAPFLTAMQCLHQGFMLRAVSSHLCPEHWTYEAELLAVLDMAGFLFSLGLRIFVAFGLLVRPLCPYRTSASLQVFTAPSHGQIMSPLPSPMCCLGLRGCSALVMEDAGARVRVADLMANAGHTIHK